MSASRSRGLRTLLIAVVVLVVLLVAADRVGLLVAEHVAADNIASSQGLPSSPDVDVAGFPFLTQLAEGSFDEITVTAHDVPVGSSRLSITRMQVVLHGVDVSRDFSDVHARTASATATVSYADLSSLLGIDVGYSGNGRISATKSVTVDGRTVRASVTTTPTLVDGALSFAGSAVNGASTVAGAVADALTKVFHVDVPLQGIPFEVRVRSLGAGPGGLTLVLVGSDLTFHKS